MNAHTPPSNLRKSILTPGCAEVPMEYDPEQRTIWAYMAPSGVPSFTVGLMRQIRAQDALLEANPGFISIGEQYEPVDYYVGGSKTPGVYSLGGDLSLFIYLIRMRERVALVNYARKCNDCLWARINNFGAPNLITIALIQGTAYGGGFESALASDFIVAERGTKFMFPEFKFNLFPGMGAFSILSRKLGPDAAMRMIMSNYCYTAEELHEMGLVTVLADIGQGELATSKWIAEHKRVKSGLRGMLQAKRIAERSMGLEITRAEIDEIAEAWADTALQISETDLKIMQRFVTGQERNARDLAVTRREVKAGDAELDGVGSEFIVETGSTAREVVLNLAA